MFKNIFLIGIAILLTSCGYEAMHSKNKLSDTNFSITKIKFVGDRDINIKIEEKLKRYTKIQKQKAYDLIVQSIYQKETIAKDGKGDPTIFEIRINGVAQVTDRDNVKAQIPFKKNFKYNNDKSRFEQNRYEKEIKENLAETISNEIILKLSNLK